MKFITNIYEVYKPTFMKFNTSIYEVYYKYL